LDLTAILIVVVALFCPAGQLAPGPSRRANRSQETGQAAA
jgi:hypothetical protein